MASTIINSTKLKIKKLLELKVLSSSFSVFFLKTFWKVDSCENKLIIFQNPNLW